MQNLEDINFPVYRKYKNNKRFYKIINKTEFEEIQLIGKSKTHNHIIAKQLPEFNFISDLILNYETFAEEITAQEFDALNTL